MAAWTCTCTVCGGNESHLKKKRKKKSRKAKNDVFKKETKVSLKAASVWRVKDG